MLVLGFEEELGRASELASELTNEFHAALRNHAQGFVLLDAASVNQAVAIHHLPFTGRNAFVQPSNEVLC